MTNYEVAVMNYPLFYQNTPEDASIRLFVSAFSHRRGRPMGDVDVYPYPLLRKPL